MNRHASPALRTWLVAGVLVALAVLAWFLLIRDDGESARPGVGSVAGTAAENSRTSVYLGFPGEVYQIEIYDPDPDRALNLATSGQIEPAG